MQRGRSTPSLGERKVQGGPPAPFGRGIGVRDVLVPGASAQGAARLRTAASRGAPALVRYLAFGSCTAPRLRSCRRSRSQPAKARSDSLASASATYWGKRSASVAWITAPFNATKVSQQTAAVRL